jgi:hypothetical protein
MHIAAMSASRAPYIFVSCDMPSLGHNIFYPVHCDFVPLCKAFVGFAPLAGHMDFKIAVLIFSHGSTFQIFLGHFLIFFLAYGKLRQNFGGRGRFAPPGERDAAPPPSSPARLTTALAAIGLSGAFGVTGYYSTIPLPAHCATDRRAIPIWRALLNLLQFRYWRVVWCRCHQQRDKN